MAQRRSLMPSMPPSARLGGGTRGGSSSSSPTLPRTVSVNPVTSFQRVTPEVSDNTTLSSHFLSHVFLHCETGLTPDSIRQSFKTTKALLVRSSIPLSFFFCSV